MIQAGSVLISLELQTDILGLKYVGFGRQQRWHNYYELIIHFLQSRNVRIVNILLPEVLG